MSSTISAATITAQSPAVATIGSTIVITGSLMIMAALLIVGVLAALVMMALTPPRTHLEFAGMLSMAVSSSFLGGPLVVEYLQLGYLSLVAQLGVCFMTAAPAWLVARIVANQLARWRDAKNPISSITKDIRDARRG